MTKNEKDDRCGWKMHGRFCIEDPFDVSLDLAQVSLAIADVGAERGTLLCSDHPCFEFLIVAVVVPRDRLFCMFCMLPFAVCKTSWHDTYSR